MYRCLYVTYCSKCKLDQKICGLETYLPEELYLSKRIQEFVLYCKFRKVNWGIFSDNYGLVLESERIRWYDKSPEMVDRKEYNILLQQVLSKLVTYNEVFFYYRAPTFHALYRQLVDDLQKHKKITLLSDLEA